MRRVELTMSRQACGVEFRSMPMHSPVADICRQLYIGEKKCFLVGSKALLGRHHLTTRLAT
jgi:hypothetical protein